MKRFRKFFLAAVASFLLLFPSTSRADMFGGDIAVLVQILANAFQQLAQLQNILSTGKDTVGILRDINRGVRDGLAIIQTVNPKFNPGLYGNLDTAERVMAAINDLYGKIPDTMEARLQEAQDRSASENIAMNGTLFRFADQADEESKRIIDHARNVNPGGAAKLTAQSIAVLIGVTTQVLRTNSMMLRAMGENMALNNRKEKLQSAQFKAQFQGIAGAIDDLPKSVELPNLGPKKGAQ